jgi:chromosome segregation ATPase
LYKGEWDEACRVNDELREKVSRLEKRNGDLERQLEETNTKLAELERVHQKECADWQQAKDDLMQELNLQKGITVDLQGEMRGLGNDAGQGHQNLEIPLDELGVRERSFDPLYKRRIFWRSLHVSTETCECPYTFEKAR